MRRIENNMNESRNQKNTTPRRTTMNSGKMSLIDENMVHFRSNQIKHIYSLCVCFLIVFAQILHALPVEYSSQIAQRTQSTVHFKLN